MNVRTTQVPGELAQYNGWTGPELLELVSRLETENERLKEDRARLLQIFSEICSQLDLRKEELKEMMRRDIE